MRNELYTDKLGKPCNNKVLVQVEDIFEGITTESGIFLPNMSMEESKGDSPNYRLSEFAIRFGTVTDTPKVITSGSYDYNTECELQKSDIVYWNIISFLSHIPVSCDDKKYLLADYHDILFRIRNGVITPVNGNGLFSPVKEEHTYGCYTNIIEKTNKWKIEHLPEKRPVELNPNNYNDENWEVGDIVYLKIGDKPFKVEGDIIKNLPQELYGCPLRMCLCTVENS
jgi:hypothetical protein